MRFLRFELISKTNNMQIPNTNLISFDDIETLLIEKFEAGVTHTLSTASRAKSFAYEAVKSIRLVCRGLFPFESSLPTAFFALAFALSGNFIYASFMIAMTAGRLSCSSDKERGADQARRVAGYPPSLCKVLWYVLELILSTVIVVGVYCLYLNGLYNQN